MGLRLLPLGIYLLGCGCLVLGGTPYYLDSPGFLAKVMPLVGSALVMAGYLLCRPALRQARAEVREYQAPGLWARWVAPRLRRRQ